MKIGQEVTFPRFNLKGMTTGKITGETIHFGMSCYVVKLSNREAYYGEARVLRSEIVNIKKDDCKEVVKPKRLSSKGRSFSDENLEKELT